MASRVMRVERVPGFFVWVSMAERNHEWRSRITRYGEEAPDQLLAHPLNYRLHGKDQQSALSGILESVGVVQNVIVNERIGHVVDGHLRITLAMRSEQPTIPVTYVDLDESEEALILATLDPIAALAGQDDANLAELLAMVETDNADVQALLESLSGDVTTVIAGLTDPDDVPAVPDEPVTQPGDLWLLGPHRLLCGDATVVTDVDRLMGGERARLMATDPPYLVDYQGGNHPQSWHNKASTRDKHWDDYEEGAGVQFYVDFLATAIAAALIPNPAIYQWHASMRTDVVMAAWRAVGLLPHQVIIWVKARAVLTRSHYMWQHEPVMYGWVQGSMPDLKPPANSTTFWQIDQQGESDGIHPTQKPVETVKRPIEYHTKTGDLIYEPFSGSGTAIIAAEQTNRRCYAIELAPEYVDVAVRRWEQFTGQTATLAVEAMAAD